MTFFLAVVKSNGSFVSYEILVVGGRLVYVSSATFSKEVKIKRRSEKNENKNEPLNYSHHQLKAIICLIFIYNFFSVSLLL